VGDAATEAAGLALAVGVASAVAVAAADGEVPAVPSGPRPPKMTTAAAMPSRTTRSPTPTAVRVDREPDCGLACIGSA
jgi:hypothetical protein